MKGFMAQKGLWNLYREKMLQDRGELPKEEGDVVREYKAMHEEDFQSSWLREDVEGIKERRKDNDEKARAEESRSGNRKVEREEEKMGIKRRCVNLISSEAFGNLVLWMNWEVSGIHGKKF